MTRFNFLAAFFLCAASMAAQTVMVGAPGMPGPMNEIDFLSGYLSLSSSQVEQAKPLFDAEHSSATKLLGSMKTAADALNAAEKSGQPDAELDRLGAVLGAVQGQLAANHSKTQVRFRALLTTEQKDKLDKMAGPQTGMAMGFSVSGGPR